jgi:hypothetical protein
MTLQRDLATWFASSLNLIPLSVHGTVYLLRFNPVSPTVYTKALPDHPSLCGR